MTDQPRRASASDLRAAVLAWWAEHECDTGSADAGDGYSEEYNIYDEPPLFVQIAQGMAESSTPAQPVGAVVGVTDQQIIATCDAAGVRWIPEGEDGFPGMFDLTKMSEMRALFAALAHPRPTVVSEARDSDLHASAPDQHHQVARAVWEHMNRRSAPGVIMSMAYTAVLHALSNAAPTVEQAGKVVNHHGTTDIQTFARAYKAEVPCAELTVHGISAGLAALEDSGYAQPLPVGVPDGWKLVPVKAMREITEAGRKSLIESSKANVTYDTTAAYAYEEMVAAAPAPGKGGEA